MTRPNLHAVAETEETSKIVPIRSRPAWLGMIRDILLVFGATLFVLLVGLPFLPMISGTLGASAAPLIESVLPIEPKYFAILYVVGAATVAKAFIVFGPGLSRRQKIRNYAVWSVIALSLISVAVLAQEKGALFDLDCSNFSSQTEAQRFFRDSGPGDPHDLDGDNDGRACEALN